MSSEMNTSFSKRLGVQQQGTPESEFSNSNFECFQNYTAPEVFIQGLAGIVNQADVEIMIRAQKQMLQRFEKTNEMLLNCNALSVSRMKTAGEDFKKHTKLLYEMKKDLDYIFKKIRSIQLKVSTQYPDAFAEAQPQRGSFAEEAEDEYEKKQTQEQMKCSSKTVETSSNKVADNKSTKKVTNEHKTSVGYVKMKQSPDNSGGNGSGGGVSESGPWNTNIETDKRKSIGSNNSLSTDNSNDSSTSGVESS